MSMKSVALLTVLAYAAHGYYLNPSIPEANQMPTAQDLPSTELPKSTAASPSQQYQHNEPAAVAFWADRVKSTDSHVESTPSSKVGNDQEGDSWLESLEKMVDPYVTVTVPTTAAPVTTTTEDSTTTTRAAYTTEAVTTTRAPQDETTAAGYTTMAPAAVYATEAEVSTTTVAEDMTSTAAYTTQEPYASTTTAAAPATTTSQAAQDSTSAYTTMAPPAVYATEAVVISTQTAQDPTTTAAYTTGAPVSPYQLNDDAAAAYWAARIKEMMATQSPLDQESIYEPTAAPTETEQLLTGEPSQDTSSTGYATVAAPQDPVMVPVAYQTPQPVVMPLPQQNQQPLRPMFVYVPQQQVQQPIMAAQPIYQASY